jgi:uncharacterized LabA/DUF88 family protein
MEIAPHIDQMVLFSGDGDFTRLVEAMQRRSVCVTVVSATSTQPPMIAQGLRRQFYELKLNEALVHRATMSYLLRIELSAERLGLAATSALD